MRGRTRICRPSPARAATSAQAVLPKRLTIWVQWLNTTLLAPVPHRQVVLPIPRRLRAYCVYRRLLGEIARVAARTVRAHRGQPPVGEGPTTALLQQLFALDPLTCPCCHSAMRLVACITRTSGIDQILTHRRSPEDGPDAPPPRGDLRCGRLCAAPRTPLVPE